jgi:hypothetical protein
MLFPLPSGQSLYMLGGHFFCASCTSMYAEWHICNVHLNIQGCGSGGGGPAKPRTQWRAGQMGRPVTTQEWRNVFLFTGVRGRPIVRLLALPLVQPHAPSRLHQRRLCRCVRVLQPVSEGSVLWTSELGGATGIKDPSDAWPRGMQHLSWRAPQKGA